MALLQLGAAAALPSADAMLDAERVGIPLHIESPHSENCPASHDHLFCQVVRSLAAVSAAKRVGTLYDIAPPLAGDGASIDRIDAELRPTLRGPTAPRPPPFG
jgi:hypothetical protein